MERLTFGGNFCDISKCAEVGFWPECKTDGCSQKKVWERLKRYEDLEEQGRLVELPCKVGDMLWTYANYPAKYVYPFEVRGIDLMRKEISTDRVGTVKWETIGKTVFLSSSEAEAAIAAKGVIVPPPKDKQTKGDHIRAMSDEELAEWINRLSILDGSDFCQNKNECGAMLDEDIDIPEENCMRCLVDWLRQPVEGNGE